MEVECISLTGLKNQTLQLSIEGCDVALSEPATSLNPDGPLASWNNLPPGLLHANHLHDLHGVQNPRGTASTNPFLHGVVVVSFSGSIDLYPDLLYRDLGGLCQLASVNVLILVSA